MRILVLDDTRFVVRLLEKALKLYGHTVFTADAPSKAFQILKAQYGKKTPVDVVLTDYRMPEMDGLAFYHYCEEELHLKLGAPLPKFMMITAFRDEALEKSTEKLGFMALLEKPIKKICLEILLRAIGSGELQRTMGSMKIVLVGTDEPLKEMIINSFSHRNIEVSHYRTLQEALPYYRATPGISTIFCTDIFADGTSILDLAKVIREHQHYDDEGILKPPNLVMVLSQNSPELQRQLVEQAMRQNVRDIISLPVTSQRLRQIIGDSEDYEEVQSSTKILIVDDVQFVCSYLEKTLSPIAPTKTVLCGHDALNICHTSPDLHLVICDLNLPDIHGLELFRQIQGIKKLQRKPNEAPSILPFIFITSDESAEIVEKMEELMEHFEEQVYFFRKPVESKLLKEITDKIINPCATITSSMEAKLDSLFNGA